MADALVSVRGLRKTFVAGDHRNLVLNGIDLDIARGQIVVVRGVSGSGKTTLLNIIGGIESAEYGSVLVGGQALEKLSCAQRTRFRALNIGFVFQFHHLIPTLTVEENVLSGLEPVRALRRADSLQATALLERVGLAGCGHRFPGQLSGGQQQRVAIARALIKRPVLILADEPTGSLDEATGDTIMKLFVEVRREQQAAIMLVTHNPAFDAHADRILEMHLGGLVERC